MFPATCNGEASGLVSLHPQLTTSNVSGASVEKNPESYLFKEPTRGPRKSRHRWFVIVEHKNNAGYSCFNYFGLNNLDLLLSTDRKNVTLKRR